MVDFVERWYRILLYTQYGFCYATWSFAVVGQSEKAVLNIVDRFQLVKGKRVLTNYGNNPEAASVMRDSRSCTVPRTIGNGNLRSERDTDTGIYETC